MLLDLLFGWLSGFPGQPPRRAFFLLFVKLYDLPLAFGAAFFITMKWAEIRNATLAPFFGAGLGRRTFYIFILRSLRPYGIWAPMPYMPRR